MDLSLDDIIAEKETRARGGRRERRRDPGPRDGVRKYQRDDSRNIDRDWVHDRFDDSSSRRTSRNGAPQSRRRSPEYDEPPQIGTKIRVDNLHWDLTEDDLQDLFTRIGPVKSTQILFDRAGRSTGRAFAVYESPLDADEAIRQFHGANANGQPIQLTLIPQTAPPTRRRNPFDDLVRSGGGQKSLADRVTFPRRARDEDSSRSISPDRPRASDVSKPAPDGIDRYVPGERTRSPRGRRPENGRRPGGRGDRNGRRGDGPRRGAGGGGGGAGGAGRRPRKTQEELDQEMEDYFGGPEESNGAGGSKGDTAPKVAVEDIEMAE